MATTDLSAHTPAATQVPSSATGQHAAAEALQLEPLAADGGPARHPHQASPVASTSAAAHATPQPPVPAAAFRASVNPGPEAPAAVGPAAPVRTPAEAIQPPAAAEGAMSPALLCGSAQVSPTDQGDNREGINGEDNNDESEGDPLAGPRPWHDDDEAPLRGSGNAHATPGAAGAGDMDVDMDYELAPPTEQQPEQQQSESHRTRRRPAFDRVAVLLGEDAAPASAGPPMEAPPAEAASARVPAAAASEAAAVGRAGRPLTTLEQWLKSKPRPEAEPANPATATGPRGSKDLAAEALLIIEGAQSVLAPQEQGRATASGSAAAAAPVAGPAMTAVWIKELEDLRRMCATQNTVIGVVGSTGAGKSSLLNALLGVEDLLPTSGCHASTSCAIEVSYHDSRQYMGSVEFMTEDELHRHAERLLSDATDEDGAVRLTGGECNPRKDAGVAQAMLEAVYGRSVVRAPGLSLAKLKDVHNPLTRLLGRTINLKPTSSERAFREEIGKYVESSGGQVELQAWPLVKVCRIQGRLKHLPLFTTLVDLPGVRDYNEARAAVAEQYLRRCDAVWVVAPIARAVDDGTAKDLLDSSFRRRLVMDGQMDSLTFICTKTDDLRAEETRCNLGDDGRVCKLAGVSPEALAALNAAIDASEAEEAQTEKAADRLQKQLRSERLKWGMAYRRAEAVCVALEDMPARERPDGFQELRCKVRPPAANTRDAAGGSEGPRKRPRGSGGAAASEAEEEDEEEEKMERMEEMEESDGAGENSDDSASEAEDCDSDDNQEEDYEPSESDEASADDQDEEEDWQPAAHGKSRRRPPASGKRKRPNNKLAGKSPAALMDMLRGEVDRIRQHREEVQALLPRVAAAQKDHGAAVAVFAAEARKLAAICARARNAFSREKLQQHFHEGLADVAKEAGDRSRAEQYAGIQLPVFCISARDAQKLEGRCKRDGAASVFSRLEHTEIPGLRRHLRAAAERARLQSQRRLARSLFQFIDSASTVLLGQRLDATSDATQLLRAAFGAAQRQLVEELEGLVAELAAALKGAFLDTGLSPRLTKGGQVAAERALPRAQGWGKLTWSTYRAAVQRDGRFLSPTLKAASCSMKAPGDSVFKGGLVHFNGQLADPILDAVSTCWDELWNRRLGKLLREFEQRSLASLDAAVAAARQRLAAALGGASEAEAQLAAVDAVCKQVVTDEGRKLQSRVSQLLADVTAAARALHVDVVEPAVRDAMRPAYHAAKGDRGAGVFGRMKGGVEGFVAKHGRGALVSAAGALEQQAAELLSGLVGRVRAAVGELAKGAGARLELLWDKCDASAPVRHAAASTLHELASKAAQLCDRAGERVPKPFSLEPLKLTPEAPDTAAAAVMARPPPSTPTDPASRGIQPTAAQPAARPHPELHPRALHEQATCDRSSEMAMQAAAHAAAVPAVAPGGKQAGGPGAPCGGAGPERVEPKPVCDQPMGVAAAAPGGDAGDATSAVVAWR
ncbi:hypothetical protein GPECTOR_9g470 [Gonium pectorale]|uniref:Dynamin N-terminal domain-containing protein n=1 Tax=Gonium pectorale TaxID=33097 RepID=A0A150GRC8_GONPE|nr:hypothetical protein GPECTOR_9g470 [Gonium pectorale]|eukprot:KXZ52426.1 hypothetical protein GPECTOR_9g470 [Gonium pectorale]